MVAKDTAERQREFRERRKETHTRMGDVWLPNATYEHLQDLAGFYGLPAVQMLEKCVDDMHAAWAEADDKPAPVAMTFRGRKLGYWPEPGTRPCPTCTGQKYVQAFADTNGVCPTCGGARVIPADD